MPGQLFRNRPVVQQAEYAFELTNAARTYFYPSFTITANGGLTSTTLSNLFSPTAVFASIVGGLAQPIFSQGLNRTRLRRSQALQQEYLYTYQQTMLRKAVEYTQELLRAGFANYTEVLQAQQSLLQAQLNGVNGQLQQRQAVTDLYHALGGGWRQAVLAANSKAPTERHSFNECRPAGA